MKRDTHYNVIGPVVQRLRKQRAWSQATLAERLRTTRWKISRSGLAKIECRGVWVGDFELLYLAACRTSARRASEAFAMTQNFVGVR